MFAGAEECSMPQHESPCTRRRPYELPGWGQKRTGGSCIDSSKHLFTADARAPQPAVQNRGQKGRDS